MTRFASALAAAVLACGASFVHAQDVAADADPPIRVGRISYASGAVSYSPAGNDEWVQAQLNRPVATGDRLWADNDARAEFSIDNSTWWIGAQTSVTVSNLDDDIAQVQVQEGVVDVRVRRIPSGSIVEIDTPNLAFSVTRPGRYRIEVDPQEGSTSVVVRDGSGDVYGEGASYVIDSGRGYRFFGTDLRDSEEIAPAAPDAFDQFAQDRDRRYTSVASARYVSPEVIGYEDLDDNGSWSAEATYGHVWFPRAVAVDWAPYREGHWAWIDPWGWTWVDDEPWGFAPFHYGRWAHFARGWGWIPGPRAVRPVYAPALVAFIGGPGFSIAVSSGPAIGWFPLAPREVYVPPYRVSRNYFRQVNVSNTVVNVTNVTNIYNNPTQITQVNYVNRRAPNGVTAVPPAAFAQAQTVSRVAVAMPAAALQRAEVHPVARVAPARPAFVGASPAARARPPAAVIQRAVVAKAAPPPPPISNAQRIQALEKDPGRPLTRTEVQTLRRAAPPAASPAAAVKIVQQAKPNPQAAPPARAAGAPGEAGRRTAPGNPPRPAAERAASPGAAPPKAPAGPAPEAQGGGARRGEPPGQARRAPGPATPPAAERAAQPNERRAPGSPATRQGPEQRGPAEPRGPETGAPAEAPAPPPVARPVPQRRGPEERAAPQARPEPPRPQPQARPEPQRPPPQARPEPQRPQPQARPEPQRPPPQARPEPPRPQPQARPEPQRPPPQARPEPQRPPPQARPEPQRPPPQARPEPQRPPPQARPEPQRPPPQARPEPPRPQPQARPEPQRDNEKDKKGDEKP